jgi:hypothetical protein
VVLLAVNLGWLWLFFTGAVVAGIGFGASFLGALRLLLPLAHAHERAGLMSAFWCSVTWRSACRRWLPGWR